MNLSTIIKESTRYFATSLEQYYNAKYPPKGNTPADLNGVAITLYEYFIDSQLYIEISGIYIPKPYRKIGLGTEIMNRITAHADNINAILTLTPSTDFGASSVARLKTFYKKFGFVENKGRNKDFRISNTMYRITKK